MTAYCALLRGIGPGNPNMRNDRLRGVFERLGLTDVASVISSGNIVFTSEDSDVAVLEDRIQAGLREDLDIPGGTIVRRGEDLRALVDRAPFGDLDHTKATYLTTTFLKRPLDPAADPLPDPGDPATRLLGYDPHARAVHAVLDTTAAKTPDYMSWLERQIGKDLTTRTWLTVTRIARKLPAPESSGAGS
ncbi:DUF1697 domain-containing protein [Georgenia deserti]|uniref:DUF1697 domain-containing protein n=1 Tax=Georgenia deserti TaxID=2093781 RepID=A0ABW4L7K8_9MICO